VATPYDQVATMTSQDDDDVARDKREQRVMWMFSGGVVLLLLGMMGANMLIHQDRSAGEAEISSQSRPAPAK
jgi:hypothetical protein